MNDLTRLIDGLCAGLDAGESYQFPTLPTFETASGNSQLTDIARYSHTSHISHGGNEGSHENETASSENADFERLGSRASGSYVENVGSVGSVGTGVKTLAESTSHLFPQDLEKVGSVGRESASCGRPALDLNRVAPQRSDWWTGPAMAEADRLVPTPGGPLPISADDVRAGVARELRHLADLGDLGVTGPEAQRRAVEIVRAKVGNSPALAVRQTNTGRCAVCDGPMGEAEAAVAVLNPGGAPLHLHADCHDRHRAARRALVDRIMAAAGYGADEQAGEAA